MLDLLFLIRESSTFSWVNPLEADNRRLSKEKQKKKVNRVARPAGANPDEEQKTFPQYLPVCSSGQVSERVSDLLKGDGINLR